MKVLHVITTLDQGGAETVLYRLILASGSAAEHTVISLVNPGFYGPELIKNGIAVHSLGMPLGRLTFKGLLRLYRLILKIGPDVIQTWMYHANLLGGVIGRLAGIRSIVWSIHNLNLDAAHNSLQTRVVWRFSVIFAALLQVATVFVSKEARRAHMKLGFRSQNMKIIPNGVDWQLFSINPRDRWQVRAELGVGDEEFLIGCVARWNSYKDHRNLLQSLSILKKKSFIFRCVLVGPGIETGNTELMAMLLEFDLQTEIILTGARSDIARVMNALDLHVLSSAGEGFGNVTVEAMACGTTCVSTNVGGAEEIIGKLGWIVPPKDPLLLAVAIENAMTHVKHAHREKLQADCRSWVMRKFGMDTMVDAYMTLWNGVCSRRV